MFQEPQADPDEPIDDPDDGPSVTDLDAAQAAWEETHPDEAGIPAECWEDSPCARHRCTSPSVPAALAVPKQHEPIPLRTPVAVLTVALAYLAQGLSVIPVRADGSKQPDLHSWKPFQEKIASEEQARSWWGSGVERGIAILGGQVSGNLEVIDFDKPGFYGRWCSLIDEWAPGLRPRLRVHKTPRDGGESRHVLYRCPVIEGNLKLALILNPAWLPSMAAPDWPRDKKKDPKHLTAIETRGEGGYIIAPGSPASVHPTGRPYSVENDVPVPTITPEERDVLLRAARSLNEVFDETKQVTGPKATPSEVGDRPGDDFNDKASWEDILDPAGWKPCRTTNGGSITQWTRPGKEKGCSATTGYPLAKGASPAEDLLYVFSSNAAPFEPGNGYSKFTAYTLLNHDGDFSAAARELRKQGYGGQGGSTGVEDGKPIVVIPSDCGATIPEAAEQIFSLLAPKRLLFVHGRVVVRLRNDDDVLTLQLVEAKDFCGVLDEHFTVKTWVMHEGKERVLKRKRCPTETAEKLLVRDPEQWLPSIRGLSASPVIVAEGRGVKVLGRGYHPESGGILVTSRQTPPDVPLPKALELLRLLVEEFAFQSPGDRSRALAAFITPALRLGGWIDGPVPVDVAEADESQAGKGFRHKLVFGVYGERPAMLTRRDGGVGGLDENISQAMIDGRPCIVLDNLRGPYDSQFLEMVVTAEGPVSLRVPYKASVTVDSRHSLFFMTSNGVDTTRDLANRCSIVRILRRTGFQFRRFPEGDLLAHVRANQGLFLGAVFAVVRAWVEAGRPRTDITNEQHDFTSWAGALDWIVQNVLGEASLLEGHRAVQTRASDPALTWLRAVALAIQKTHQLGRVLHASTIAELCEEHDIALPGLKSGDEKARNQRVGVLLGKVFADTTGRPREVEGITITRRVTKEYDPQRRENRDVKTYVFTVAGRTQDGDVAGEQPQEATPPHELPSDAFWLGAHPAA